MLTALSIRDVVLIEALDLEFGEGLGVLTGETGAGKSILLDALGLALGARGGVFIAGGIAPRIIDLLEKGEFRSRFESKGRLSDYTKAIPTHVVMNPHTALIGAAVAMTPDGRAAVS